MRKWRSGNLAANTGLNWAKAQASALVSPSLLREECGCRSTDGWHGSKVKQLLEIEMSKMFFIGNACTRVSYMHRQLQVNQLEVNFLLNSVNQECLRQHVEKFSHMALWMWDSSGLEFRCGYFEHNFNHSIKFTIHH